MSNLKRFSKMKCDVDLLGPLTFKQGFTLPPRDCVVFVIHIDHVLGRVRQRLDILVTDFACFLVRFGSISLETVLTRTVLATSVG